MHSRTGHGPDPGTRQSSVLETPRLRLEVPDVEDAAELFRLVGGADREAICATLIWDGPDHLDDMVSWIRRCREEPFAVHGLHWLIRDRTGAITGCTWAGRNSEHVTLVWKNLPVGTHKYWARIDSANAINETSENDNVTVAGTVTILKNGLFVPLVNR